MAFADKIIEISIALLVFGALAGVVLTSLDNINTSDPTLLLILPFVGVFFVLMVAVGIYYEMRHKGK